MTADQALARLLEGNERFVRGEARFPTVQKEILADLAKGAAAYATILGCSDSRVPPNWCSTPASASCSSCALPATSSRRKSSGRFNTRASICARRCSWSSATVGAAPSRRDRGEAARRGTS